jgi:signal transduction histidine kinase
VRRRLLVTYVTLLAAALLGLDIPLAITLAGQNAQTMFIDRQGDAARFASLAEPALRTGRVAALEAELNQYDAMFGILAAVVARDGHLVVASRANVDVADPAVRDDVAAALSGQRADFGAVIWPWSGGPLVVAEPVGSGGEIIGAVLIVSPIGALHTVTWQSLAVLAVASLVVLGVGVATAGPLSRWMLKGVDDLNVAAHALAEGRFDDRVAAVSGPPELRDLVASFNGMADRITTLIRRQRSFVSYASHQLRTPLATLRLCLENLHPSVQRAGEDDYQMLADELERMGRMCDALLEYAQADLTADAAEDIDAAAIADARVAIWGQAATRAGVQLARTGLARAPARAATQALDQALDALLSNAVKFAGAGATVTVRLESIEPGWVDVHVQDDGPGMPPDDLARAREPFWRRAAHQNVEGSGLGMAIADALVKASGGRLDLASAVPHGLHARIRLPAARVPVPPVWARHV